MAAVDWTTLEAKTNTLRTLSLSRDLHNIITDTVFSGLRVKLSELVAGLTAKGATTLSVWADTLVIDYPTFNTLGTVVVARSIDNSLLGDVPMPMRMPAAGGTAISEFLVKETASGKPLTVAVDKAGTLANPFTIPVGTRPLQAAYYTVASDGKGVGVVKPGTAELNDLLARPFALNSLKASFTAATWLMASPRQSDRDTAKSMLEWVVACTRALGDAGALVGDFAELAAQAAALLVSLNVASGACYVPLLSSDYYRSDINRLLGVLSRYESNLQTLDVRQDIQGAVDRVSGTLADVSGDEKLPAQAELDNITANVDALARDIGALRLQFQLQNYDADTKFVLMQAAIESAQVKQFLVACVGVVVNVAKAAVAAGAAIGTGGASEAGAAGAGAAGGGAAGGGKGGGKEGGGDILGSLFEAGKLGYEAIDKITTDYSSEPLPAEARKLIAAQEQLMVAVDTSARLWAAARAGSALAALPDSLAAVSIDPSLAWDNYMVAADRTLTNLKRLIGSSGAGSGAAQDAATDYLASLKILAQYGKAIAAKFVAYSGQLSRATIVQAQIAAADSIEKRWQVLQKHAQSDEEKLAGLKGLIVSRADAVKRSAYVAWTNYRNAFFYLNFTEPPTHVALEMNAAQLSDAFASVAAWTERLLGETDSGDRVRLPNEDVKLSIPFTVVKQNGESAENGASTALLVPAQAGHPAIISLTFDLSDPRLVGRLPKRGDVAIWVKEASFFVDGVKPNAQGNVIMNVATSGSYQNGFGAAQSFTFVTKGFESYFGYAATDRKPTMEWRVDTNVYMTPTPFTQWTMTFDPDGGDPSGITSLRMDMVVAFRART
jgi:hypothetical protein